MLNARCSMLYLHPDNGRHVNSAAYSAFQMCATAETVYSLSVRLNNSVCTPIVKAINGFSNVN